MTHTLLVIDDDEAIRDACAQTLGRNPDYVVATAPDAEAGLRLARELQPDAALVDLKLPGKNGIEIIQDLRRLDPDIVAVVITGYPTVSSAVEAMKNGAYDFLPKPFTPDELRLIVKRALDKRRLERETQALRRERELLQRNIASLVSHELRSPLNSVQQYLEAFLAGAVGPVTPQQRTVFERIRARLSGLLELIDEWLNLHRLKSGKLAGEFNILPLLPIVQDAVETLRPLAESKGVSLTVEPPTAAAVVRGDAACLKELVLNLLANGIKYNRAGGSVTVRLSRTEGGELLLEVRDTGRGIPPEDLPRLFDEFFRGKNEDGQSGHGLGLSIAKQIAELHGGSISASSHVGEGSVFAVRLPAAGAQA